MNEKYPRTYHVAFSPNSVNPNHRLLTTTHFLNKDLVFTEKMDGGNCSMEQSGIYARSHSGTPDHPSFDILKSLHASIKSLIPPHIQLFGEILYAKHSIYYDNLPSYFMLFGVRNLRDEYWESWKVVEEWAKKIGVPTVPVMLHGNFSSETSLRKTIESLAKPPSACGNTKEGVVFRTESGFSDTEFKDNIAKWVRKDHVQSSNHWTNDKIVKNLLKGK